MSRIQSDFYKFETDVVFLAEKQWCFGVRQVSRPFITYNIFKITVEYLNCVLDKLGYAQVILKKWNS